MNCKNRGPIKIAKEEIKNYLENCPGDYFLKNNKFHILAMYTIKQKNYCNNYEEIIPREMTRIN